MTDTPFCGHAAEPLTLEEKLRLTRTALAKEERRNDELADRLAALEAPAAAMREALEAIQRMARTGKNVGDLGDWRGLFAAIDEKAGGLVRALPLPASEPVGVEAVCTCKGLPEPPSDDCPLHGESEEKWLLIRQDFLDQLTEARADLSAREAELAEAVRLLEPFAGEAAIWADSVPDDYRSLCTDPGSDQALPGSETTFTIGDLRAAAAFYAKHQPKESA